VTIPFTPFDDDDDQRPSKGREPDPVEPLGAPGPPADRPSALDDDDDDEPVLGTAPTLSKAEAAGRRPTGAGSSSDGTPPRDRRAKRRSRPVMGLAVVVLLAAALAGVPLLRSAFQRTPKDRVGISYGGGPVEGVHFQKIVAPGSGLFFNGFFDSLYLYPADQLNYILADTPGTKGQEATTDAVVAPTSDRVTVSYQVAVYYKLNTDQLRAFHEQLGLRYQAYTDDGWDALIADTLRQQIEAALQEETRRHTVADLYGDADLLRARSNRSSVQATMSASPRSRPWAGGTSAAPTFADRRRVRRPHLRDQEASTSPSRSIGRVRGQPHVGGAQITTRDQRGGRQREEEARGVAVLNAALQPQRRGPTPCSRRSSPAG
jgi:hypothetical protein